MFYVISFFLLFSLLPKKLPKSGCGSYNYFFSPISFQKSSLPLDPSLVLGIVDMFEFG